MKPQTIGRVLGVGLRVAVRVAGQRLTAVAPRAAGAAVAAGAPPARSRSAGQVSRAAVNGVGGFLRPFRRVGGIVWLEVTGVFFLLPALVFAPTVWQTRMSWAGGPDHRRFVSAAIVVLVFSYLGITSFVRARRRAAGR